MDDEELSALEMIGHTVTIAAALYAELVSDQTEWPPLRSFEAFAHTPELYAACDAIEAIAREGAA